MRIHFIYMSFRRAKMQKKLPSSDPFSARWNSGADKRIFLVAFPRYYSDLESFFVKFVPIFQPFLHKKSANFCPFFLGKTTKKVLFYLSFCLKNTPQKRLSVPCRTTAFFTEKEPFFCKFFHSEWIVSFFSFLWIYVIFCEILDSFCTQKRNFQVFWNCTNFLFQNEIIRQGRILLFVFGNLYFYIFVQLAQNYNPKKIWQTKKWTI